MCSTYTHATHLEEQSPSISPPSTTINIYITYDIQNTDTKNKPSPLLILLFVDCTFDLVNSERMVKFSHTNLKSKKLAELPLA